MKLNTTPKKNEDNAAMLRGLMKLEGNKTCSECNEKGPIYACTTHGTFVCQVCAGILREFGYRAKSVTMTNFTQQEATFMQQVGNQRAAQYWLGNFNPRTDYGYKPQPGQVGKIRTWIQLKYTQKKWCQNKEGYDDDFPVKIEKLESILGQNLPDIVVARPPSRNQSPQDDRMNTDSPSQLKSNIDENQFNQTNHFNISQNNNADGNKILDLFSPTSNGSTQNQQQQQQQQQQQNLFHQPQQISQQQPHQIQDVKTDEHEMAKRQMAEMFASNNSHQQQQQHYGQFGGQQFHMPQYPQAGVTPPSGLFLQQQPVLNFHQQQLQQQQQQFMRQQQQQQQQFMYTHNVSALPIDSFGNPLTPPVGTMSQHPHPAVPTFPHHSVQQQQLNNNTHLGNNNNNNNNTHQSFSLI